MKKIDCLGKVCPIPVIETKKLIKENPDEVDFEILVDNEVATQNLAKMAKELKIESSTEKIEDGVYKVSLKKGAQSKEEASENENKIDTSSYVVAISDDRMGKGDEDFSKSLLEGFIFYNRGVFLTAENEKTIEDLKVLADKGVEILSCGLCLGNYKLKEKLAVGEITNMYKIVEILRSYHTVSPC